MGLRKTRMSNEHQVNLYDRIKKLLVTMEWSDCSFSVGKQTFKAHKLLLGITSPVFDAMFYGSFNTDKDIIITDIEPEVFQLLLNYIYTDKVIITSTDQAFDLLYASKKYILDHLAAKCIEYIHDNVTVDNVIEILNYPDFMQDNNLLSYSLKLFGEHAQYLLQEKKNLITYQCMKSILECNNMNITEKDLIKHVFEWSTYFCDQHNLPVTFENRRKLLIKYGLFKLLRFKTLTIDGLKEIYSYQYNLLTSTEVKDINYRRIVFDSIMNNVRVPIDSIFLKRHALQLEWHVCYRSPIRPVAPICINGSGNNVIDSRLKVTKSVFISSICIPSRMEPLFHSTLKNLSLPGYTEKLSLSITGESNQEVIYKDNIVKKTYYGSIVELEITGSCLFKKNEWYTITFTWPGCMFNSHSYVLELRNKLMSYNNHNVTFEFDDFPSDLRKQGSFIAGLKFCV